MTKMALERQKKCPRGCRGKDRYGQSKVKLLVLKSWGRSNSFNWSVCISGYEHPVWFYFDIYPSITD